MLAQGRSKELNRIMTHFTETSSQVCLGRVESKTSSRHFNVNISECKEPATASVTCGFEQGDLPCVVALPWRALPLHALLARTARAEGSCARHLLPLGL